MRKREKTETPQAGGASPPGRVAESSASARVCGRCGNTGSTCRKCVIRFSDTVNNSEVVKICDCILIYCLDGMHYHPTCAPYEAKPEPQTEANRRALKGLSCSACVENLRQRTEAPPQVAPAGQASRL